MMRLYDALTPRITHTTFQMIQLKRAMRPVVIRHRPEFQTAAEKGKALTEIGVRGKGATDEIRALWDFLNQHARRPATPAKPKLKAREVK
jgi:hypothetical protein